jgi:hypothetical protein
MTRQHIGSTCLVAVSVALCHLGCNQQPPSQFASKVDIYAHPVLRRFILAGGTIEDAYVNRDVDAAVFIYTTAITSSDLFWTEIDSVCATDGWQSVAVEDRTRLFERRRRQDDTRVSVEQLRVGYAADTRRACIGYVQLDVRGSDIKSIESTDEGSWAERNVWPRWEQLWGAREVDRQPPKSRTTR